MEEEKIRKQSCPIDLHADDIDMIDDVQKKDNKLDVKGKCKCGAKIDEGAFKVVLAAPNLVLVHPFLVLQHPLLVHLHIIYPRFPPIRVLYALRRCQKPL